MALPGPLPRRDPVRAWRAAASVTVLLACLLALQPATASPAVHAAATPSLFARQDDSGSSSDASLLPTGVTSIEGQPLPTSSSTPHDPLLAIMPEFVFSMPAQIVVDGINLSLVSILAIQLIFTAQYHFPLSRKNYSLQLVSVLMLLISVSVHLHTVLNKLEQQSHVWPYMFAYIGVQIPPQDGSWTLVEEAFYLLMRAVSSGLVHLTHIQFLTLLFPSALEARLILWMLGPLALVASGMEFTALSSDKDVKTSDLGDAIRNICNSALFLLYTSALLIWGVLVNRGRAWRTDGGTAAFGGGSVGLAFINTSISFVEIAYDRLWWLPDICWTLTIWQSWLGFWWWVGSGMGIGEVEDRAERQERKRKKEEKLERKRAREERSRQKASSGGVGGVMSSVGVVAASSSLSENSDAILGGMRRLRQRLTGEGRGTQAPSQQAEGRPVEGDHIETGDAALTSVAVDDGENADEVRTAAGSSSDTQPTTSGAATSTTGWMSTVTGFIATHQPDFIKRRMRRLRLAHVAAAQRAATEQSALRDQVLNRQPAAQGPGLRAMMFERPSQQGNRQTIDVLHRPSTLDSNLSSTNQRHLPVLGRNQKRASRSSLTSEPTTNYNGSMPATPVRSSLPLQATTEHDEEWADEETEEADGGAAGEHGGVTHRAAGAESEREEIATTVEAGSQAGEGNAATAEDQHSSWSWRGGLRTLRMRDHTTYD